MARLPKLNEVMGQTLNDVINKEAFLGEMQRIIFRLMLRTTRVCVCVSVCVCMPRLWTSGKRFEIETCFCAKLRGITPDIICRSLTQILLQIPRWRTKWRP